MASIPRRNSGVNAMQESPSWCRGRAGRGVVPHTIRMKVAERGDEWPPVVRGPGAIAETLPDRQQGGPGGLSRFSAPIFRTEPDGEHGDHGVGAAPSWRGRSDSVIPVASVCLRAKNNAEPWATCVAGFHPAVALTGLPRCPARRPGSGPV